MATTIHPHKGYLNTLFHVFSKGNQEIQYEIFSQKGEFIRDGKLIPNEPHSFSLNLSGDFTVKFSDGTSASIYVEDGYKYGGSKHKKSYIFDNSPWLFIVMHDRTYFFNRESKEAYLETISPDIISLIGTNYILLKNNGQDEQTVYSLEEQKPILDVSRIAFFNNDCIIWEEKDDNLTTLLMYSFISKSIVRQNIDFFEIDIDNKRVLYVLDNIVKSISLDDINKESTLLDSVQGKMVAIVKPYLAISYEEKPYGNYMHLYNLDTKSQLKKLLLDGYLAKIGSTTFINVYQRRKCMDNVDFESNDILDTNISVNYLSLDFYPTSWDVFYTQKHTKITRNRYRTEFKEKISLHSIQKNLIQELNREFTNHFTDDNIICLYNSNESWVNSVNGRCDYVLGGKMYIYNKRVFLEKESLFYRLSKNGYWDEYLSNKYNTEYLDEFGFIVNQEDNNCQTLGGFQLGKLRQPMRISYQPETYTKTDKYYIFSKGRNIKAEDIKLPTALSENLQFGINIDNGGIYLCKFENGKYEQEPIIVDLFDSSKYQDVLLSEDGKSIMYRDGTQTTILDIENGQQISYDNLSYIKQINGIRPQFKRASSLQPRIINPITKLPVDSNSLTDFQFVSPDGKYYADTRLEDFIEYFYRSDNKLISKDEYQKMIRRYQYPWQDKKDSPEWLRIKDLRKSFLFANYGFLVKEFSDILRSDGEDWGKEILEDEAYNDVERFLSLIIGKRGIAVIRNTNDSSAFTKIDLGEPLSFINYVSFSFDSKFVAIAGHRYESHLNQGLLLIYDLSKKETILYKNTNRAVWFVAFSESNALGAYTSNPFTFFVQNETEFTGDFDKSLINHRNFLTFSPDGKYFALSEQGYISKYDRYGNINSNWGHQPSSLVEIHNTFMPKEKTTTFTDLSDAGTDGVAVKAGCVASVSFSNENKRIMMVGKDGVVIVRNLHLHDYAGE